MPRGAPYLTEHARQRCAERGLRVDDVLRIVGAPFALRRDEDGTVLYVGRGLVHGKRWMWVGAVAVGSRVLTAYDADAKNGMRPAGG